MSKYFEIYNYLGKLKAILVVYQLNGKYAIWWKETKKINNIRSSELNSKIFKKYFKQKYLQNDISRKRPKCSITLSWDN